jgi:hypothetical protein
VVLRYARRVPGTDTELPAGTVGEVAESPDSNNRPADERHEFLVGLRLGAPA